jgi:hypothetical protein
LLHREAWGLFAFEPVDQLPDFRFLGEEDLAGDWLGFFLEPAVISVRVFSIICWAYRR